MLDLGANLFSHVQVRMCRFRCLQEWLLWEVCLDRHQLLWMEAFLEYYDVCNFFSIKKLSKEAAAFLHMKSMSRQKFFQQLKYYCRESAGQSRRHHAPDLSDVGKHRRASVYLQLIQR